MSVRFGSAESWWSGEPACPLINVLLLTIGAALAGADDFVAIATFANTTKRRFAEILDTTEGVPSHDRFIAIKPGEPELMRLERITRKPAIVYVFRVQGTSI
ncbi:transposase family protein [Aporhodopirellula aestuarii]|uniref:Transposase family protein n=1 Tax=Aporhodopirellula aestuarii TaxID=2950107 RepID=A0ABT0U4I2_9BACT|nr:transposase family protein [Aporhodopirellula aestuarii]MCM2371808.1 transposase family protein [Aporhodopirellula aestuarii]